MKVRAGLVRAFVAVLGIALLVMPVGVIEPDGVRALSLPEAMAKLATGTLGVGVLSAAVGGLIGPAVFRLVLVALSGIAFYLAGMLRAPAPPRFRESRHSCPACGFVTARRMTVCPACGARVHE